MRKITLFLMSLFLTVGAMAQDYVVGQAVTDITTGYYAVEATFNPGNDANSVTTGAVYYNSSSADNNYRLDVNKTVNTNDILTSEHVWHVENNGTTITLRNVQDNVYFVKDEARNQNFSGTETAYLYLEKVSDDDNDKRFYLHLEEENIGYIHCNGTGSDSHLSYWNANSANASSCVRFTFYKVEELVVVSALSDFNPNKCYTVSTPSRGGWSVNGAGDNFCSTNDNGFGTDVDAANTQNQFAVLTIDNENYYLFSVHANKFVKADRTLVEEAGDAIKFDDASSEGAGRVLVSFKGYNDKYINLGGGNQMVIDDWGDGYDGDNTRDEIDAGNAVKFIEVADFDPSEALAMLAGNKSDLLTAINEANELLEKVADHALEKGEKIDITGGKISSNAAQNNADGNSGAINDGAGIAGLTDNDPATYFHSRWGGTAVNEAHYLQIDLGEGMNLSDFCFEYAVRKTDDSNRTSPAPTKIEVRVSEDGNSFSDEPVVTYTTINDNLPVYSDLGATLWYSNIISANKEIRYIRLTVTDSQGPGNNTWEGQKFFAMGTLNLYSTKYTDDYTVAKDEYEDKITADQVSAAVNALKAANEVFNNTAATDDEINNATSNLNDVLVVFKQASISHTLTVTSAGWATLYLDFPAAIPDFEGEGNGVFIATKSDVAGYVHLTPVEEGTTIPANTGVIVKAIAGDYTFAYSAGAAANVDSNLLEGSVSDEYIQDEAYVLANINVAEDGQPEKMEIGMYKAKLNFDDAGNKVEENGTRFLNNANKAYLPANALSATAALSASLRFDFDGTTAIEEVETEAAETVIYDLTGRRVNEITKAGVYIVNGKKVLVK